jgi:hypothetical protein
LRIEIELGLAIYGISGEEAVWSKIMHIVLPEAVGEEEKEDGRITFQFV